MRRAESVLGALTDLLRENLGLNGVHLPPMKGMPFEAHSNVTSEVVWLLPSLSESTQRCPAAASQRESHLPRPIDVPMLGCRGLNVERGPGETDNMT